MAKKSVFVGCRLPHGLIIEHPMDPTQKVTLKGANQATIVGSDYGVTEVDGDFFEQWIAFNETFPAVTSGSIFVAKSFSDVTVAAKDVEKNETGFEPMSTDGKDKRAAGVNAVKDDKD